MIFPFSSRNFVRVLAAEAGLHGGGLGAAGMAAHFTHLAPISALAQSGSSYKALVCVFFFGGNDSNNMIVPTLTTEYNNYASIRHRFY